MIEFGLEASVVCQVIKQLFKLFLNGALIFSPIISVIVPYLSATTLSGNGTTTLSRIGSARERAQAEVIVQVASVNGPGNRAVASWQE
jgi:hypothetical protein